MNKVPLYHSGLPPPPARPRARPQNFDKQSPSHWENDLKSTKAGIIQPRQDWGLLTIKLGDAFKPKRGLARRATQLRLEP